MQKEYLLQGLDCANCAAKIENAVKNQSGVLSATLNFMTTSLKLEVSESYAENITAGIADIVRKYEPDVVVIDKGTIEKNHDHGHDHSHGGESSKKQIIQLITGAVIFGAGILMSKLFELNIYAELAIFLVAYLILGGGVVLRALKNITKGQIFDENFLMSVATIGAFAIGDFPEAVAVMLFYQIGEYFQDAAVRSSKKSIADLMDIRPDSATIKKGNELVKVSPETVAVGDFIVVKPGEKIPLDGVVIDGESMLDTKALTGESVPRTVKAGDTALSGCINQNGVLTIEVTKTFGESTVATWLRMLRVRKRRQKTLSPPFQDITPLLLWGLRHFLPLFLRFSWAVFGLNG